MSALGAAALGTVATGALGPGRLSQVGVEVIPVAVTFALLAAAGFALAHGLLMVAHAVRRRRDGVPHLSVVPDVAAEPAATTQGFLTVP